MSRFLCSVTLLILFPGCSNIEKSGQTTGPELLAPFKTELMQALQTGMANGLEEAINICKLRAPGIADSLSIDGVQMGRTSDRLRNPNNTAPDWVWPVLEAYLTNPSDRKPRALTLRDSRSGYVEPIIIQPLCTACHGTSLASATRLTISELYPEDKATGYEIGGLRGVFWVEYAK